MSGGHDYCEERREMSGLRSFLKIIPGLQRPQSLSPQVLEDFLLLLLLREQQKEPSHSLQMKH